MMCFVSIKKAISNNSKMKRLCFECWMLLNMRQTRVTSSQPRGKDLTLFLSMLQHIGMITELDLMVWSSDLQLLCYFYVLLLCLVAWQPFLNFPPHVFKILDKKMNSEIMVRDLHQEWADFSLPGSTLFCQSLDPATKLLPSRWS